MSIVLAGEGRRVDALDRQVGALAAADVVEQVLGLDLDDAHLTAVMLFEPEIEPSGQLRDGIEAVLHLAVEVRRHGAATPLMRQFDELPAKFIHRALNARDIMGIIPQHPLVDGIKVLCADYGQSPSGRAAGGDQAHAPQSMDIWHARVTDQIASLDVAGGLDAPLEHRKGGRRLGAKLTQQCREVDRDVIGDMGVHEVLGVVDGRFHELGHLRGRAGRAHEHRQQRLALGGRKLMPQMANNGHFGGSHRKSSHPRPGE